MADRHSLAKEIWPKFLRLLLRHHFHLFSKTFREEIRQLRFPKSEVGGVIPKHEVSPYREFNVAAAVRDVSCVTCRACDVARDRSI